MTSWRAEELALVIISGSELVLTNEDSPDVDEGEQKYIGNLV